MNRFIIAQLVAVLVLVSNSITVATARADPVDDACSHGTWANCGNAVKQQLDQNPTDPQQILHLAQLWATSFSAQYDALRQRGQLTSTPDADHITDAIADQLNPLSMAKDAALDAAVKKILPQLSTVLEFAGSPLAQALKEFFNSTAIASDYDELKQMNDGIQDKIFSLLQPKLVNNWKDLLNQAATSAAPSLNAPNVD